jgi:hypothetical protein
MQKAMPKSLTDIRGESGPPTKMNLLFQPGHKLKEDYNLGKEWVRLCEERFA